MKKFTVYILILTFIFPAYCFSSPSEDEINDNSDISLLVEEIFNEIILTIEDGERRNAIKLIVEDGIVEIEEIEDLLDLFGEKVNIDPSSDIEYCLTALSALPTVIFLIYLVAACDSIIILLVFLEPIIINIATIILACLS